MGDWSCKFFVMAPPAADCPLVSPNCHLCHPESPVTNVFWEGGASEGELGQVQGTVGARAVPLGVTLAGIREPLPQKEHQGAAVSQGRIWGSPHPNRPFLLGFAVFPGSCCVPALLLSNGKAIPHMGWSSLHFCVGAVISASPQDRISALSSENKPLGRGGAGGPFVRGSPSALCSQVPQIQCWCCLPTAMELWGSDSCLAQWHPCPGNHGMLWMGRDPKAHLIPAPAMAATPAAPGCSKPCPTLPW